MSLPCCQNAILTKFAGFQSLTFWFSPRKVVVSNVKCMLFVGNELKAKNMLWFKLSSAPHLPRPRRPTYIQTAIGGEEVGADHMFKSGDKTNVSLSPWPADLWAHITAPNTNEITWGRTVTNGRNSSLFPLSSSSIWTNQVAAELHNICIVVFYCFINV